MGVMESAPGLQRAIHGLRSVALGVHRGAKTAACSIRFTARLLRRAAAGPAEESPLPLDVSSWVIAGRRAWLAGRLASYCRARGSAKSSGYPGLNAQYSKIPSELSTDSTICLFTLYVHVVCSNKQGLHRTAIVVCAISGTGRVVRAARTVASRRRLIGVARQGMSKNTLTHPPLFKT